MTMAARAESLMLKHAQIAEGEKGAADWAIMEASRKRAEQAFEALIEVRDANERLSVFGVNSAELTELWRKRAQKARADLRRAASDLVGKDVSEMAKRIGGKSVDEALSTSSDLAKFLSSALAKSAEQERLKRLPSDLDRPLAGLTAVPGSTLVRLDRVKRSLETSLSGLPASELPERFETMLKNLEWWHEIGPELDAAVADQHPDVRGFLEAAISEEGAKWSAVSSVVLDWLDDEENASSIRIFYS